MRSHLQFLVPGVEDRRAIRSGCRGHSEEQLLRASRSVSEKLLLCLPQIPGRVGAAAGRASSVGSVTCTGRDGGELEV